MKNKDNISIGSHSVRVNINKKEAAKYITNTITKYTIIMIGVGMLVGAGILAIIFHFLL